MLIFLIIFAVYFVALAIFTVIYTPSSVYDPEPHRKNPMEGKKVRFVPNPNDEKNSDGERGHLEVVGPADGKRSLYDRVWKRSFDILLSFCAIFILSPLFLILILAILIDDPGPILFTQTRVGKNKQYFKLHKFRSMKMSTPRDVPTHRLKDPEQYITRVGKFLRKTSLDELPQIGDIFIGNMSIIGPRPALWNQDVLIAERDKYGANDVRPGLTGWAQINGRDELEIREKAKLDGVYCEKLRQGGFTAMIADLRCFFGTFFVVLSAKGVVEGKRGALKKPMRPNDGSTLFEEDNYQVKKKK